MWITCGQAWIELPMQPPVRNMRGVLKRMRPANQGLCMRARAIFYIYPHLFTIHPHSIHTKPVR